MSNDAMDADDGGCKNQEPDNMMDVSDGTVNSKHSTNTAGFLHTPEKENKGTKIMENNAGQVEGNLGNVPLSPAVTNTTSYHSQQHPTNERGKSVWTVKSPMLVRPCPRTFNSRRKSQENCSKAVQESANKPRALLHGSLGLEDAAPSAFTRKDQSLSSVMDIDLDNNILKRCNSAPILNDPDENSFEWSRPAAATTGRVRRFSANIVSLTSSPVSSVTRSRLRLHQLKKEESIEGIQNKEAEREREIQTTLQISSNCGDLSLGSRRLSLDSSSLSPKTNQSPSSIPIRAHFHTPPSSLTGVRSSYSRAIDFNAATTGSGALPHAPSHHATSGGIPSPLTFSASPSPFNISPLPSSPTRTICGPGKQCFSPSMHIPVCLALAASRSPSPSPTRRTFVTRRRSQSPCIMRPSALGPIKRKYDSDSEGSYSPKRIHLSTSAAGTSSTASDGVVTSSSQHTLVQRSHSLSSSSVDSSDMYVSPSPPHHSSTFVTTHHHGNHHVTGFVHPLQYSSSPLSAIPVLQTHDSSNRSNSPTNSTCSSSSLEGLRDLPPLNSSTQALTSTSQRQIAIPKKS